MPAGGAGAPGRGPHGCAEARCRPWMAFAARMPQACAAWMPHTPALWHGCLFLACGAWMPRTPFLGMDASSLRAGHGCPALPFWAWMPLPCVRGMDAPHSLFGHGCLSPAPTLQAMSGREAARSRLAGGVTIVALLILTRALRVPLQSGPEPQGQWPEAAKRRSGRPAGFLDCCLCFLRRRSAYTLLARCATRCTLGARPEGNGLKPRSGALAGRRAFLIVVFAFFARAPREPYSRTARAAIRGKPGERVKAGLWTRPTLRDSKAHPENNDLGRYNGKSDQTQHRPQEEDR